MSRSIKRRNSLCTSDSITSTGGQEFRTYGIQVLAAPIGGAETVITAGGLTITSKGISGHAVQAFRRGNTDQTSAAVTLNNSTITTQGFNAYGMQVNADGTGQGVASITANNLTFSSTEIGRAWCRERVLKDG